MRIGEISNMKGFFFYPQVHTDLEKLSLEQRHKLFENQGNNVRSINTMNEDEKGDLRFYLDHNNYPTHKHSHVEIPELNSVPIEFEIYRG